MLIIVGLLIVFASVVGGYIMAGGNVFVLWQPAEVIIILGAAIGAFVASNSSFSLKLCIKGLGNALKNGPSKNHYLELLALLYGLFAKMQREGVISIEKDIESPESSALFTRFPLMVKDPDVCFFIGDTLRIYLTTGNAGELEKLMGVDMETMNEEKLIPAHNIVTMAESLPAMGIVAAVLGVVLTMGHIDAEPKILGEHIGNALVGTFMGILLCYGIIGPFGHKLVTLATERNIFFKSVSEAVAAAVRGSSPIVALEYGRRAIPLAFRPTFLEMEQKLKG